MRLEGSSTDLVTGDVDLDEAVCEGMTRDDREEVGVDFDIDLD